MKKSVFIYDHEKEYACSLMEAVNSHRSLPFILQMFSNDAALISAAQREKPEVLLVSPEYYSKEIRELNIPHVMLLSDGQRQPTEWNLPQIHKYQRADSIIRMILSTAEMDVSMETINGKSSLVAIYSPLHRVGKTAFAISLCKELSGSKKALYINLEDVSGFELLLEQEFDTDLSDLMYYARQSPEQFQKHLLLTVRDIQGVDYIPPARVPMELKAVKTEEWMSFLELVQKSGLYDVVVMDCGDGIQGLPEILSKCDRIYTPAATDMVSKCKITQYEDMLEIMDYTEVLARTRKLMLPGAGMLMEDCLFPETILWGPMNAFVKNLVEGEAL